MKTQIGYTIGMWITVPLVIVLALLTAACLIFWIRDGRDSDDEFGAGVVAFGFLFLVTLGIHFVLAWPYDMSYHQYKDVTGTVDTVVTRSYAENKGSTQYYGVKLTDGTVWKCGDMRCGQLQHNDTVSLWCVKEYQFGPGTPGYTCDWNKSSRES